MTILQMVFMLCLFIEPWAMAQRRSAFIRLPLQFAITLTLKFSRLPLLLS
jgi:hypothetical protein